MIERHIDKYLERYAEPEASFKSTPQACAESALVIPAFDEPYEALKSMIRARGASSVHLIFVLNAPEGAPETAIARTRLCYQYLSNDFVLMPLANNVSAVIDAVGRAIVIVDRCSPNMLIPKKQGVGLARKIGGDIALRLFRAEGDSAVSNRWVFQSDADAELPAEYFATPPPKDSESACIFPFVHYPEDGFELATKLYDIRLHYYVEQLNLAQSPYAFFTIGSTIAVSAHYYAQVRGVPKRSAGEDFYLLNKLRKLGVIRQAAKPTVGIQARASARVPFGTGPAISKIQNTADPIRNYTYYHPDSFKILTVLLESVRTLPISMFKQEILTEILTRSTVLSEKQVAHLLDSLSMEKFFGHIAKQGKNGIPASKRLEHFNNWFDAFKTLKFIHYLRDHHFPNLALRELLAEDIPLSNSLHDMMLSVNAAH